MMKYRYFALLAALSTVACGSNKEDAGNQTENSASVAPQKVELAGDWVANAPVVSDEGDMSVKMTNLRYNYFSDNKHSFSGQLSISGGELPDAMNFKVTGDGTYIKEGKVLRQDLEKLSLTPSTDGATEQAVADELEKSLRREPSSIHDILELSEKKLRLRDRESGKIIELTRGE